MEVAEKRANEWNLIKTSALTVILQSEASKQTYAQHSVMEKCE
jgi:hypothetical protein